MLTVIVTIMTITGRFICSVNSYCDNKGDVDVELIVIVTIMTITGRSMCSVNSCCDNKGDVDVQC